jgi:phosphotransferase system enzyme I (PtsI)
MKEYSGKTVCKGIAIGTIAEMKRPGKSVRQKKIDDPEKELARYEKARLRSIEDLQKLHDKALREIGEQQAAVFEAHQTVLDDPEYNNSVRDIITSRRLNAEYAVESTGDHYAYFFSAMSDEYMQARADDIKDITLRLIANLKHTGIPAMDFEEDTILIADDLTPSETVQIPKHKVLAFVTRKGSRNSHASILARTMNLPSIVKVKIPDGLAGRKCIVDGFNGTVIVDPDPDILKRYKKVREDMVKIDVMLSQLKGKGAITKSGRQITLCANITGVDDLDAVLENDAEGIGLFRTEFLYLKKNDYPTEDEQFEAYRTVARKMEGRQVVIRTLDIGADKEIEYFDLEPEANPQLGCRGIRLCFERPDVFRTQLRAIYRASAFGNISILLPMIASLKDLKRAKEIISDVRTQLKEEKVPMGVVRLGVMIETPAAVLIADDLAQKVDFFSIGTNDLMQYIEAVDRQNQNVEPYCDPYHPALFRAIKMAVDAGHREGIRVGICGELGADTSMTESFINIGVDELSMTPSAILSLRDFVRRLE